MTLWLIFGGIGLVIGAVVWLNWRGEKAGRASAERDNLDAGIKDANDALAARDRVRTDPDYRDSLRDKYRPKP